MAHVWFRVYDHGPKPMGQMIKHAPTHSKPVKPEIIPHIWVGGGGLGVQVNLALALDPEP